MARTSATPSNGSHSRPSLSPVPWCSGARAAVAPKAPSCPPGNKNGLSIERPFLLRQFEKNVLDGADDGAEDLADSGPQQGQDDDDHDGHQNQDQGVFHQALALIVAKRKHS